jgi:hypothetical protein
MELQFKKAIRKSAPIIISISGPSGSGKTYSALLMAAGLAGPNGRVGFVDTENGRGCFYADSPGIMTALPNGFEIIELDAPFSPERYIAAIDAAEKADINVLVIDSGSHEWEGTGGCSEMAERDKGRWNKAKQANRKYVYRLLYSTMHIIVCLRARERSKIIPKHESITGKEEVISLGILPIAEKNFVFEMLMSLQLDEKTHHAIPVKVPEPLVGLFPGNQLITKADGERIREWNESGASGDSNERLKKRARAAAEEGTAAYSAFFRALTPPQKKVLANSTHTENKQIAAAADSVDIPEVEKLPDAIEQVVGTVMRCNGATWAVVDSESGYQWEAQTLPTENSCEGAT